MTEREIIDEFLRLFSHDWNDPTAHQGFQVLRGKVSGQDSWPEIIEARLMTLDGKMEDAVALLKKVSDREPLNAFAALLLGMILLNDADQPAEAVDIYDSINTSNLQDQASRQIVEAFVLRFKGTALGELDRSVEAIEIYDEVVRRYGDSPEASFQEPVAVTLFSKGLQLLKLGRTLEAIEVYDEIVKRCGSSPDDFLQELVGLALFNKGMKLGDLGRSAEAIAVLDEIQERFAESEIAGLREFAEDARSYKKQLLEPAQR